MAAFRRRLPAPWRVLTAGAILAVGGVAAAEVHRLKGIPLFLSVVACGVLLGGWALGVVGVAWVGGLLYAAIAFGVGQTNSSGDNLGAEAVAGVTLFALYGTVGIVAGMGLRALVTHIVRLLHTGQ
jgi:hypothetical protein